jgi:hypothetical protein
VGLCGSRARLGGIGARGAYDVTVRRSRRILLNSAKGLYRLGDDGDSFPPNLPIFQGTRSLGLGLRPPFGFRLLGASPIGS